MKEALKLALEALQLVSIEFVCNGAHHAKKDRHDWLESCPIVERYQAAITAIKAALAKDEKGLFIDLIAQHEGLAEELAQPEQEPVAWPCEIETADFEEDTVTLKMQSKDYFVGVGLHWLSTTPPKRPWVRLTDEDWEPLYDKFAKHQEYGAFVSGWDNFTRAIEAKLKELNT